MSKHSPFPWSYRSTPHGSIRISDANGIEFAAVFNCEDGDSSMKHNAWMIASVPGLLMAAMRGHGWGDPVHIEAHPECTMCHAIRIAVGDRTRERVLELAAMNSDHVRELIDTADGDEDAWREVYRFLGIAEGDPYATASLVTGEFAGIDADILEACTNA